MLMLQREHEPMTTAGRAEIGFGRAPGGRTFLRRQFAAYPFHICRPHYFAGDPTDMVTLYLQSLSGGIYEHERLSLAIAAEPGTQAHVTSQASTIVHSMETGHAELAVSIEADDRALVEFLPDPLILFPRARLCSAVKVRRHDGATVICSDAFLAHDPEGADRSFDSLDSRLDVEDWEGRLLARDRFVLTGEMHRSRRSAERRNYGALASIVVLTGSAQLEPLLDTLRSALDGLPETYAGASALPNDCGLRARILSADGASLRVAMHAAWSAVREAVTGVRPQRRRK